MNKHVMKISGMDCATCAEKIKKMLLHKKGIKNVEVFLASEKIEVYFDESSTNKENIEKDIKELGYKIYNANLTQKEHEHSTEGKKILILIIVVLIFLVAGFFAPHITSGLKTKGLWELIAAIIGGFPLIVQSLKDLRNKSITADVFMSIGVVASILIGEFRSAAIIALFMLVADYIDSFTMEKARKAIKSLIEEAPKKARIKKGSKELEVNIEDLKKDDIVIVKPGEKIPVEGVIVAGHGSVNQSIITGESIPVEKKPGDTVYAATINEVGVLFVKITHVGEDTTYARIIRLIQEAEASKAPLQKIADKFATYFTPLIIVIAIFTYLITFNLSNAIAVIVVACPCSVAIATPLAVIASMGTLARIGVIVKGGKYLEALAKVDTIVMDKTGTLTMGDPVVVNIKSFSNFSEEDIITYAAIAEKYSEHPLAKAILKYFKNKPLSWHMEPEKYEIVPGKGIVITLKGKEIILGSREMAKSKEIFVSHEVKKYIEEREEKGETMLFVVIDRQLAGVIGIADILKKETKEVIDELKKMGIKEMIMLTGDNERTAKAISNKLGIDNYKSQLLPEDKLNIVKRMVDSGKKVLMIGDGINDAPALAQANVGIAMGYVGTDVAIESSDVVIMKDDWRKLPTTIKMSKKTFNLIKQNLFIGILFNIVGVSLASLGILSPAMAAVAHVIPDILVFINSSRLLSAKENFSKF